MNSQLRSQSGVENGCHFSRHRWNSHPQNQERRFLRLHQHVGWEVVLIREHHTKRQRLGPGKFSETTAKPDIRGKKSCFVFGGYVELWFIFWYLIQAKLLPQTSTKINLAAWAKHFINKESTQQSWASYMTVCHKNHAAESWGVGLKKKKSKPKSIGVHVTVQVFSDCFTACHNPFDKDEI